MTPGRAKALDYIRDNPGARAVDIAEHVSPRRTPGRAMSGWSTQAASRFIGSLLKPLIADGKVERRRDNGITLSYYVSK